MLCAILTGYLASRIVFSYVLFDDKGWFDSERSVAPQFALSLTINNRGDAGAIFKGESAMPIPSSYDSPYLSVFAAFRIDIVDILLVQSGSARKGLPWCNHWQSLVGLREPLQIHRLSCFLRLPRAVGIHPGLKS